MKYIKLFEELGDAAEDVFIMDKAVDKIKAAKVGDETFDDVLAKPEFAAQAEFLKNYGGNTHYASIKKYKEYLKKEETGKAPVEKEKTEGVVTSIIDEYTLIFNLDKIEGSKIYGVLTIEDQGHQVEYTGYIVVKDNKPYIAEFQNDEGENLRDSLHSDLFKYNALEMKEFFVKCVELVK